MTGGIISHADLAAAGLCYSGEIKFLESDEIAHVECLVFFKEYKDLCRIEMRGGCFGACYHLNSLAVLPPRKNSNLSGNTYISNPRYPYQNDLNTSVQIYLHQSSFRRLSDEDGAPVLLFDGKWIEKKTRCGFYGLLRGVSHYQSPPTDEEVKTFKSEFNSFQIKS
jgi:hypothetical protein